MNSSKRQHDGAGYIDGGRLYTLRRFLRDVGLGENTKRRAERKGIALETFTVGRMTYVRGGDGIAWLEALGKDRTTNVVSDAVNAGENGHVEQGVTENVTTGDRK